MEHGTEELIKIKQLLILTRVLLDTIFRDNTDRVAFLNFVGPDVYDNLRILWYELHKVELPKLTRPEISSE